jgi:hypothetical protein
MHPREDASGIREKGNRHRGFRTDIAVRETSCMLWATTLRGQFKETTVTKNLRSWSCAAALALLSPLALSAQVLIQVKDVESGEIIGSIRPGGSFTIDEGDEVRLIMSVGGRGGRTLYPQTEFWESQPNRGCLRITRASVENANATLKAVCSGRSESIGYSIVEDIGLDDEWTEGSVTLRVSDE